MSDHDLPGDEAFPPAPNVIETGGMLVNAIPTSIEEQQAIHHNRLRYAELQKLRLGQPNRYEETSYR